MKVILSSKWSKFSVDFENAIKLREDVDGFEDNCVWSCYGIFCQLWQEYMWSTIKMVKTGPKISDPITRHHTQVNLFDIDITLA